MEKTKVAIVGLGTVGAGVARLLLEHGDRTGRDAGRTLWLEKAVVRDLKKSRGYDLPSGVITTDLNEVLKNPDIQVVAQLVGGLEPVRGQSCCNCSKRARTWSLPTRLCWPSTGRSCSIELARWGCCIAFEAAVAGGIPIITNVSQCFSANQVLSLHGILNGTSNFIVSQMDEQGWSYDAALKEAQRLGFAEADPAMDVDGTDAAQKLAILGHRAFRCRIRWNQIPRVGIDSLDAIDLLVCQRARLSH